MAASVLKTSVKAKSPDFEKNHRRIVDLLTKIKKPGSESFEQTIGVAEIFDIDLIEIKKAAAARQKVFVGPKPRAALWAPRINNQTKTAIPATASSISNP